MATGSRGDLQQQNMMGAAYVVSRGSCDTLAGLVVPKAPRKRCTRVSRELIKLLGPQRHYGVITAVHSKKQTKHVRLFTQRCERREKAYAARHD